MKPEEGRFSIKCVDIWYGTTLDGLEYLPTRCCVLFSQLQSIVGRMATTKLPSTVKRDVFRRQGDTNRPQDLVPFFSESIALQTPMDVLVKIHAVALNYRDFNILRGTNPWPVKAGGVPGTDAAGEVVATGSDVMTLKVRTQPIG